jgi:hypothetical protein
MKNIPIGVPVVPEVKICTKCVLPSTFPGISFNNEGVCIHCQKFETFKSTPAERAEYKMRLQMLIHKSQAAGNEIDVLMAYSGGKDSTYSMRLLVEKYGANVRAFTFDNGFISPQALRNIKTVCANLGVSPMIIKYDQDMLNKVFRYGAENEMYSPKTMERASTICTICSGFFKSIAMGYSLDMGIPLIGYGWSPGQAPIQSSLQQSKPRFVKMAQQNAAKPVVNVIGNEARQYFLQGRHYEIPEDKWPISAHPLAFEDYNEDFIKENIKELGWSYPKDVDSNSTNCQLNAYANQVHLDRYHFHPYAMEIANMVRQGSMSREEGIEKIYGEQNQKLVRFAQKVLFKS